MKNLRIFDFYLLKNLAIATLFVAIILTLVVFLTQSLRFLEIVINSGTSGTSFWTLTILALPRFFEVILPLSAVTATLFIYNKLTIDSELTVMRAVGHSPFRLALPALLMGLTLMLFLWITTMWLAPLASAKMQKLRVELTTEFSNYLFREGVFNPLGKGLTVYIHKRTENGELAGLMIQDTRDRTKAPSTVLAKRGVIVIGDNGQQVVVFDGSRQEYDQSSGILQRLNFDRYTIDLPENTAEGQRWAEPDERTMSQLLNPDLNKEEDRAGLRDFKVELHRRFTSPILALAFPLIALSTLLLGSVERRGHIRRITLAVAGVILIQGLYVASYNLARHSNSGFLLMYALTFIPLSMNLFLLSEKSEKFRRRFTSTIQGGL